MAEKIRASPEFQQAPFVDDGHFLGIELSSAIERVLKNNMFFEDAGEGYYRNSPKLPVLTTANLDEMSSKFGGTGITWSVYGKLNPDLFLFTSRWSSKSDATRQSKGVTKIEKALLDHSAVFNAWSKVRALDPAEWTRASLPDYDSDMTMKERAAELFESSSHVWNSVILDGVEGYKMRRDLETERSAGHTPMDVLEQDVNQSHSHLKPSRVAAHALLDALDIKATFSDRRGVVVFGRAGVDGDCLHPDMYATLRARYSNLDFYEEVVVSETSETLNGLFEWQDGYGFVCTDAKDFDPLEQNDRVRAVQMLKAVALETKLSANESARIGSRKGEDKHAMDAFLRFHLSKRNDLQVNL